MKKTMMFSVDAIVHNETRAISSRTYTFFRPYFTNRPTYLGAARMVAAERRCEGMPTKISDISVLEIRSNVHMGR
jgi:hypothetical protein